MMPGMTNARPAMASPTTAPMTDILARLIPLGIALSGHVLDASEPEHHQGYAAGQGGDQQSQHC